ncbi:hypothetical protein GFY24_14645 [Nocardia sp. SYP-A9097]|uniref:DUF7373 family lipoprotein n=1 Tax=Nocardia sp. SYP-A9097 TaxID=2663237 RepID=UPI00129B1157|nr:hypothetical protein [Nocardia sp. SYP-A9097]MRH88668.1 hypothetical protein [Nocardia sp. SYP-A9097]
MAAFGSTLLVTAGCGGNGSTAPDYGPYPHERIDGDYDTRPSLARGLLVESLRLGERVLYASSVDPDLKVGRGSTVLVDYEGVTGPNSGPHHRVLDRYQVTGGFSALAANKPYDAAETSKKFLMVSLLAFPDEQTATAAAGDMERSDFEFNSDNVPVTLDAYPEALNHWRPGVPTVGSLLQWKSLVIQVFAEREEADLGALTEMVTSTLRQQLAALETFTPTPVSELASLRLDPDGLLPLLVKTGDYTPDDNDFSVYGVHTYATTRDTPAVDFEADQRRGLLAVAYSHNKVLYRLRDAGGATDFASYLTGAHTTPEYVPMRGVAHRRGITCGQATQPATQRIAARRFRCVITSGAYVAVVYSNVDTDVRQLAAAQDSVLAEKR